MKRVLVLVWISLVGFKVIAQIPERKNRALVYKITATWCYPCGTWGWDLANALNADLGDDIIYLALFNSSNGNYNNSAFYNAVAVTLAFNFRHSSWPSFGVNGYNLSDINGNQAAAIQQACFDSALAFNSSPVIANAASEVSIDPEGIIQVATKATFFEMTEGDYYLASYLVEEGAVNQQYGQSGLVEHKGVLRIALDSLDWGSLIATDAIDSGHVVSKSYTYTATDESWDLSKLVVCNIIWKKVGTKYVYVNGSKHRPGSSEIKYINPPIPEVAIYPNPAIDALRIDVKGPTLPASLTVMDVTGRELTRKSWKESQGYGETLDVSDYPEGLYFIQLSFDKRRIQRKVWIR